MDTRSRRLSIFLTTALLLPACGSIGRTGEPTAEVGEVERVAAAEAGERPSFDRERYRLSAQSPARADLLACRNPEATITRAAPADVREFAQMLHGTWVNVNRRTVHGMPVETDAVFLIDMRGNSGQAILIDRNNMGIKLNAAYQNLRSERPLALTQVDCTYEFVDQYVKVSDEVSLPRLARGTGVALADAGTLQAVWNQLSRAGYFDALEMRTGAGPSDVRVMRPRQGDTSRVAVVAGGQVITEQQIQEGEAPGAEYRLPMLTGGFFKITLSPVNLRGNASAIRMRWNAIYRGAGLNIEPGREVAGVEQGLFLKEAGTFGSTYLCPIEPEPWTTSECADKNGLDALRTGGRLRDDPAHSDHPHEDFVFARMVIGVPSH